MTLKSEFDALAEAYTQMYTPVETETAPVSESTETTETAPTEQPAPAEVTEESAGTTTAPTFEDTADLNSAFQAALNGLSVMQEEGVPSPAPVAPAGDDEFDFSAEAPEGEGDEFDEVEEDGIESLVYQLKDVVDQLVDALVGVDEEEAADAAEADLSANSELSNVSVPEAKKATLGTPLWNQKVPTTLTGKNNKVPNKLKASGKKAALIKYQKAKSDLKALNTKAAHKLAKKGNQKVSCPTDNLFGTK